jgi:hypothetical protein
MMDRVAWARDDKQVYHFTERGGLPSARTPALYPGSEGEEIV